LGKFAPSQWGENPDPFGVQKRMGPLWPRRKILEVKRVRQQELKIAYEMEISKEDHQNGEEKKSSEGTRTSDQTGL